MKSFGIRWARDFRGGAISVTAAAIIGRLTSLRSFRQGSTAGAGAGSPGRRTRLRMRWRFFAASLPLPAAAIAASRYPEDDRYRSSAFASTSFVVILN